MDVDEYPQLLQTALDCTDARELAEFYRQLLGLRYLSGDEPPTGGVRDDADWLVLIDVNGLTDPVLQSRWLGTPLSSDRADSDRDVSMGVPTVDRGLSLPLPHLSILGR